MTNLYRHLENRFEILRKQLQHLELQRLQPPVDSLYKQYAIQTTQFDEFSLFFSNMNLRFACDTSTDINSLNFTCTRSIRSDSRIQWFHGWFYPETYISRTCTRCNTWQKITKQRNQQISICLSLFFDNTNSVFSWRTIRAEFGFVLVAIRCAFAGSSSALKYIAVATFVSNLKMNADVIGTRRNPINQIVLPDEVLSENDASFDHVRFALVFGIGGLELPRFAFQINSNINNKNEEVSTRFVKVDCR